MSDATPVRSTSRVGVRDVARAAGVSTQTVSRVLNEHPGIRAETRERVLAAMSELDYRVNNAARALGTSRTRTIGILASDASMYGPAVGILALEAAARAAGRWVTAAYADAGDEASVVDAARHLSAQGVDGIVVVAPHARTLSAIDGVGLGLPVVALHGPDTSLQTDAARIAIDHLADAGHRRIAHLAGPDDWIEAVARADGFAAALAGRRLNSAGLWRGDWSAASGLAAAAGIAQAVRSGDGPTAVFVANDQMALGLIAGLVDAGVRVPEDVSVVGVDDNPDAAYYRPALTTVRLDIAGEAARCVAELIGDAPSRAGGADHPPDHAPDHAPAPAPAPTPAAPALISRASSAPPA